MKRYIKGFIKNQISRKGYELIKKDSLPISSTDFFYKILNSALNQIGRESFQFLQIGANDGMSNDPIHEFILKESISGFFVEPLPDAFNKLKLNYDPKNFRKQKPRLFFIQAAITDEDKPVNIYRITQSLEKAYRYYYKKHANPSGASSLDYKHVESFLKNNVPQLIEDYSIDECIDAIEVKGMTINSLLKEYNTYNINRIDLLQVDTEGYDYKIIKQVLESGVRPAVINFEYKNILPGEKVEAKQELLKLGYSLHAHKGNLCGFRGIELISQ